MTVFFWKDKALLDLCFLGLSNLSGGLPWKQEVEEEPEVAEEQSGATTPIF